MRDELANWAGPGYPDVLRPLLERFRPPWVAAVHVGQGWWPLLLEAHEQLSKMDPGYWLCTVREELADLVFDAGTSLSGAHATAFHAATAEIVRRAGGICEVCGGKGRFVRERNIFIVLCWEHQAQRGAVPVRDGDDLDTVGPRIGIADYTVAVGSGEPPRAYTRAGHHDAVAAAALAHATEDHLEGWLTTAEVAAVLGVSPNAVHRRLHNGRLVAARRSNGQRAFPSWQLTADGARLRGLDEVLTCFAVTYDAVAITHVLLTPRDAFAGMTAVHWLTSGRDIDVVAHFIAGLR